MTDGNEGLLKSEDPDPKKVLCYESIRFPLVMTTITPEDLPHLRRFGNRGLKRQIRALVRANSR